MHRDFWLGQSTTVGGFVEPLALVARHTLRGAHSVEGHAGVSAFVASVGCQRVERLDAGYPAVRLGRDSLKRDVAVIGGGFVRLVIARDGCQNGGLIHMKLSIVHRGASLQPMLKAASREKKVISL